MAITILELESYTPGGARAVVEHGGRRLSAHIAGPPEQLRDPIGTAVLAEIEYQAVRASRVLLRDKPDEHGLYPDPSGAVRTVGRVHNVIRVSDDEWLVDVYVEAGPEFLCLKSSELSSRPQEGDALEVVVDGLCFHPTWG